MSKLIVPLFVLVLFAVVMSVTVGIAVGLGYVLKWLIPALDVGTATLIILGAMVFFGLFASAFVVSAAISSRQLSASSEESDDDENGAEDELLEVQAELVADRLLSALSNRIDIGPRRRRK